MNFALSKPEPHIQQVLIPSTKSITLSLFDGIKAPDLGYVSASGLAFKEDSVIVHISQERNQVFLMNIRGSIKRPKSVNLDQLKAAI